MRKIAVLLLALILLGCVQNTQNSKKEEIKMAKMGEEIAKKVKDLYNSTKTVEGWEYLTLVEGNKTYNDSLKFVVKKPDKVWMYDLTYNAYLISNGSYTWIYDKNKNTVKVEKSTPEHPPDYVRFLDGMLTIFNVTYFGNKSFDGINCYVLKLIPKGSTNINVYGYAYITPEYKLKGIFFKLNNTIYNIRFEKITYNTTVNDSFFNFKIPKGAKVYKVIQELKIYKFRSVDKAQKYAKFKILTPSYSNGYLLKEVCVYGYSVLLEYTKGANEMLIKESLMPMPYPINSKLVKVDNLNIHLWKADNRINAIFKKGNVTVYISTPMNETETIKICRSLN